MKNNNKALAVFLAAVLSLSLAACGDKASSEDKETEKTTTTTAAAEESKAEETTTAPADTTATDTETTPAETVDEPAELEPEETPTEAETKTPELIEIGKMDAEDVGFYKNEIIYKGTSDEDLECLNFKGENIDGGDVPMVSKLGDTGLYSFCKKGGDIVYQGLMDEEGNVVLGADQGVGSYEEINDRFLKAYLPEGETKNKDEAIYYVSANQFTFQPTDEDILYKGTVKVYDTKTGKFLENTAQDFDPNYSVNDDIISFYDKNNDLVYVNADDKVLDLSSSFTPVGIFLTEFKDNKCFVYDHDMNPITSSECTVFALDGTDYYFRLMDSTGDKNKNGIMSAKGRVIVEPKYDNIYGINDKYFQYVTEDNKVGLLKDDGTELTKPIYKYIVPVCPGYFSCTTDDSKSVLIDKTGKEIFKESGDDTLYALDEAPYAKIGDEYCYLVYGTGEMSLKFDSSSSEYLGHGLLNAYKEKAIYDLQTGEKLLDGFDKAYAAYDHLYVLNGDEYTIYEIK